MFSFSETYFSILIHLRISVSQFLSSVKTLTIYTIIVFVRFSYHHFVTFGCFGNNHLFHILAINVQSLLSCTTLCESTYRVLRFRYQHCSICISYLLRLWPPTFNPGRTSNSFLLIQSSCSAAYLLQSTKHSLDVAQGRIYSEHPVKIKLNAIS